MAFDIITEQKAEAIIAAAGFSVADDELHGIAWQMDDLANRIISMQWNRREDANKQPRKGIGREVRRELFLGLEHIWLDLPASRLAATNTDPVHNTRTGRASRYIKAYCGAVSLYVMGMELQHPSLTAMAKVLAGISENDLGEVVREGLAITGFRRACLKLVQEEIKKSPLSQR